jgi:hypothetical protein
VKKVTAHSSCRSSVELKGIKIRAANAEYRSAPGSPSSLAATLTQSRTDANAVLV